MRTLTYLNSRNQSLVGDLYEKDTDKIVIFVHGFIMDRHSRGLFDDAIEKIRKLDYSVFAFDFSGCGESDDESIDVDKQVDDLDSTIDYLYDLGYSEVALIGHSLGGLISFKVGEHRDIKTIIAWAPVTDKKPNWHKKRYSNEQLKVFQEKGFLTINKDNGTSRNDFMISKQFIFDRAILNQEELLTSVECPVLMIQGTDDKYIPLEHTKKAMDFLSEESDLILFEGINHNFEGKRKELYQETIDWLEKHF